MRRGRPSKYTPALADAICARLAAGETLSAICRDPGIPHRMTVLRWLEQHPDFRGKYARARIALHDRWADEIIEIAESGSGDVRRDQLRIDARKWLLSKLEPTKYGEWARHEITGSGGEPLKIEIVQF